MSVRLIKTRKKHIFHLASHFSINGHVKNRTVINQFLVKKTKFNLVRTRFIGNIYLYYLLFWTTSAFLSAYLLPHDNSKLFILSPWLCFTRVIYKRSPVNHAFVKFWIFHLIWLIEHSKQFMYSCPSNFLDFPIIYQFYYMHANVPCSSDVACIVTLMAAAEAQRLKWLPPVQSLMHVWLS